MRSLEQRGNEGWGEGWDGSTCGSILGSGYWVVLAVLGRSLVELSGTLGVRLKNRPPLFTVKNWAADKKPCKVMSAGCTTCNIYNRHTQYLVKNVEDAHGSSHTLFVVKSRPVVRRLKILGYASIHLWWSLESGPADYNWVRETRERVERSRWSRLLQVGCQWTGVDQFGCSPQEAPSFTLVAHCQAFCTQGQSHAA